MIVTFQRLPKKAKLTKSQKGQEKYKLQLADFTYVPIDSLYIIPDKVDIQFIDENNQSVEEDYDLRAPNNIEITDMDFIFENSIGQYIDLQIIDVHFKTPDNLDEDIIYDERNNLFRLCK